MTILADQSAVRLLHSLYPATGFMCVGAGNGVSIRQLGLLDAPVALLIEADERRLAQLEELAPQHPNWRIEQALIAERDGTADFFEASNRNESGLVPPEQLRHVWPNLQTLSGKQRPTKSLASLLREGREISADCLNWLHIDCLTALSILKGAGDQLHSWDVVIARALREQSGREQDEHLAQGPLEAFMSGIGYRLLMIIEERHPAVTQLVFVRDWKQQLSDEIARLRQKQQSETERSHADIASLTGQLTASQAALQQLRTQAVNDRQSAQQEQATLRTRLDQLQRDVEALTAARDEQAALANERAAQIDALTKARDEQAALANERAAQIDALTKARDEQAALANERAAQIDALAKARDEQAALANERAAQIDALTKARDEQAALANERAAQIDALTKARDEQAALANERAAQIDALTKARDEQAALANERAAQIDALAKARDEQAALAERRMAELETLGKARDEQAALANERAAQIDALTRARDEQAVLAEQRRSEIERHQTEHQARLSETQQKRDTLQAELEAAQAEATRNGKLLALKQADLDHLRQQYAALNTRCDAGQALLREVKAKLLAVSATAHRRVATPNQAEPVAPVASPDVNDLVEIVAAPQPGGDDVEP